LYSSHTELVTVNISGGPAECLIDRVWTWRAADKDSRFGTKGNRTTQREGC